MRIGLIRHFKVTRGYPNKIVTSSELMKWLQEYNDSDVEENKIDLQNIKWKKCFSSDISRAKITAEKCFDGEIVFLKELREITLSPVFQSSIKLPLFIHLLFIRLAWYFDHKSQTEKRNDVLNRIKKVLDEVIQSNQDVLIVSHGGIMLFLRKELKKRGFKGPKFNRAANGTLYLYEK